MVSLWSTVARVRALFGLEPWLRATLDGLRGSVTVIVIAHRLSTLDICDRLMVIQDGELKAVASSDELRADSAFYGELLELSGLS